MVSNWPFKIILQVYYDLKIIWCYFDTINLFVSLLILSSFFYYFKILFYEWMTQSKQIINSQAEYELLLSFYTESGAANVWVNNNN